VFAFAAEPVLSWDAYGVVQFGRHLADIEKSLGEKATADEGEEGCKYVYFKRFPKASFMVEDGIITRADVGPGVANSLGVPTGTPMTRVKKKYPKVIVRPHQYDDAGFYLIVKNNTGTKAIVMEIGDGTVQTVRGGLEPSVEYVEGCL
jgi:hypothetical protein